MAVNLRERAYQHIRQKLLVGDIAAGQRLSEVSLAKEIGVSRTPVREAVSQLASEGFIDRDPSVGVFVKQVSRAELMELLNLRVLLEPYAAGRAAKRATDEQLAQLGEAMDRLRAISRQLRDGGAKAWRGELGRRMTLADMIFHMAILAAAHSPRVAHIIDDFHVVTTRYRPPSSRSLPNLARVLLEHWRIYRAIRARDPQAARLAMRIHSTNGKRKTLDVYLPHEPTATGALPVTDWSAILDGLSAQADTTLIPKPYRARVRRVP
jgi:DNA-binding GntR family transcriptional regulator